jgi:hypothetical protein
VSIAERYQEFCRGKEAEVRLFAGDLFRAGDGEGALEMFRMADRFQELAQDAAPLTLIRARRRA